MGERNSNNAAPLSATISPTKHLTVSAPVNVTIQIPQLEFSLCGAGMLSSVFHHRRLDGDGTRHWWIVPSKLPPLLDADSSHQSSYRPVRRDVVSCWFNSSKKVKEKCKKVVDGKPTGVGNNAKNSTFDLFSLRILLPELLVVDWTETIQSVLGDYC